MTIPLSGQERAGSLRVSFLRLADGILNAISELGNIGLANGGYGDGLARFIEDDGLERRVFREDLDHRTGQARWRVRLAGGFRLGYTAHQ